MNLITKANHSVMMIYLFCKKDRSDPEIVRLLLRKGFDTEMLDGYYRQLIRREIDAVAREKARLSILQVHLNTAKRQSGFRSVHLCVLREVIKFI